MITQEYTSDVSILARRFHRAQLPAIRAHCASVNVSILARRFHRAQPFGNLGGGAIHQRFQSSPGVSTGRNFPDFSSSRTSRRFNPRPAFPPGATQPNCASSSSSWRFQSSPGVSTGRNTRRGLFQFFKERSFNPRPAFPPGATVWNGHTLVL